MRWQRLLLLVSTVLVAGAVGPQVLRNANTSTGDVEGQTCSSFGTCEAAIRAFRAGNTRLDGDGDGIPCEALCGNDPAVLKKFRLPFWGWGRNATTQEPAPGASQPRQSAPQERGPVDLVSVGDGDTIRVLTSEGQRVTIRLACIDAPETAQGESGAAATQALKQMLAGRSLEIAPQTIDRYGRTVAEVYANGRNVNLKMVEVGAAYVYRQYLSGCNQDAYLSAEQQAGRNREGVWRSGGTEERPWDFRRNRRRR